MVGIRDIMPWTRGRRALGRPCGEDSPFIALQREMNRVFDTFMRSFESPGALSPGMLPGTEPVWGEFIPQIDVQEGDNEIKIWAELPGIDPKHVNVSLSGSNLIIQGEKSKEDVREEQGYYRAERSFGSFYRAIPLPVEVESGKIDASFKNGVLMVLLPKSKKAVESVKKIPIKTS